MPPRPSTSPRIASSDGSHAGTTSMRSTSQRALSAGVAHLTPESKPITSSRPSFKAAPSLSDKGERVKVCVRVRPAIGEEQPGSVDVGVDGKSVRVNRYLSVRSNVAYSDFEFDKVLPTTASQMDVYDVAGRPVVEDVLMGYNGTIMAYGQTGAGKTYTVGNEVNTEGMISRASAHIFEAAKHDSEHEYQVYMSYLQIYCEIVHDLLVEDMESLNLREDMDGKVYVEGARRVEVKSVDQALRVILAGEQNRVYACTKLNAHSSRSHAITIVTVEKRRRVSDGTKRPEKMVIGKLFLVDLAGSERLKKSKSEGVRKDEAKAINKSLSTLGMCINARADPNATYVPFRDSKLTRLLQESLGGNCKTTLIVCIPDVVDHVEETVSSMLFGSRAMQVKTRAQVNEVVDYKAFVTENQVRAEEMEQELGMLEARLAVREEEMERLVSRLQQSEQEREKKLKAVTHERDSLQHK
ncbi:unnamed protein product [Pedinophyceae sp. YPF-701]|nr:unnamed protein product [Pedinophyceae sp. YPF-701]